MEACCNVGFISLQYLARIVANTGENRPNLVILDRIERVIKKFKMAVGRHVVFLYLQYISRIVPQIKC